MDDGIDLRQDQIIFGSHLKAADCCLLIACLGYRAEMFAV